MEVKRKFRLLILSLGLSQIMCGDREIIMVVIEDGDDFKGMECCVARKPVDEENKSIINSYLGPKAIYTQVVCDPAFRSHLSFSAPKADVLILCVSIAPFESDYRILNEKLLLASNIHDNKLPTLIFIHDKDQSQVAEELEEAEARARELLNQNRFDGNTAPVVHGSILLARREYQRLNLDSRRQFTQIFYSDELSKEEKIAHLEKELPTEATSEFGLRSVVNLFGALDNICIKPSPHVSDAVALIQMFKQAEPELIQIFKKDEPKLIQMAKDAQNAYKNLQKGLDRNQAEQALKDYYKMDLPECQEKLSWIQRFFNELEATMSEIFKKQALFKVDTKGSRNAITQWLIDHNRGDELVFTDDVLEEIINNNGLEELNKALIQMAQKSTNTYSNLLILSQLSELTQEQKEYFEQLAEKCKIEV